MEKSRDIRGGREQGINSNPKPNRTSYLNTKRSEKLRLLIIIIFSICGIF